MNIKIRNPLRFYCFILVSMCFLSLLTSAFLPEVHGQADMQYETVHIRSGDSLWSIAETYKPEHIKLQSFIREIKECNQMEEALVYAGTTLLVPVYPEML